MAALYKPSPGPEELGEFGWRAVTGCCFKSKSKYSVYVTRSRPCFLRADVLFVQFWVRCRCINLIYQLVLRQILFPAPFSTFIYPYISCPHLHVVYSHATMPYLDLRELNALTQLANRGGLGSAIAYVPLASRLHIGTEAHKHVQSHRLCGRRA